MNGSIIPFFLAFLSGIIAIQLGLNIFGQIFFLIAMCYVILGGLWNDLGKDPNEKDKAIS